MTTSLPENEAERLEALRQCGVMDTEAEDAYDNIVRLAAHICGTPIAAVSLVDSDRQWFKSILGLEARETPREVAFCAHTILQDDVLIVPDAGLDRRFADNPLVTGEPHIRFYAGAPLITSDGHALGSLCVIDREAREITADQALALRLLAAQAAAQVEAARRLAAQQRLIAERDQAEAERRRLAAIVESSSDAIYSATLDRRITSWNSGAERLYGYTAAEVLGRDLDLLVPPDRHHEVEHLLDAVPHGHPPPLLETVRLTKAGAPVIVSLQVSPIRAEDGRVVGKSMIARDVSERKRTEASLEREREFTRALLESLQEGIAACDADGTMTLFNRATRQPHGLPERPLPPEQWAEHFDLYHADGVTPMNTQDVPLFRALQGEEVRDAGMVIAPQGGPHRTLLASGRAIYGVGGEKLGAVVAMHDVTERRAAERENARFAAIVDASHDAISAATLDGTIVSWNGAAERLYGRPAAHVIGRHFSALAPPGAENPSMGAVARVLRGEPVEPVEVVRERPDGSRVTLLLSYAPMRGEAGEITGVVCVGHDITERQAMEEALRESHRFAQSIADNSTSIIFVFDLDAHTNVYSNRSVGEFLGYPHDRIQALGGDLLASMLHPDDLGRVLSHFGEFADRRDGEVVEIEYRARHADGGWRWIWNREVVFKRHPDGTSRQIMGTAHDITDRKRAEEALRESEARLAEAQRVAQVGSWEFDLATGRIAWSDQLFRLFGLDPAQGEPGLAGALALYHPDDAPQLEALVARAARTGAGYKMDLRRAPHGGGPARWYHTVGTAVRDAEGRVVRLTGTLADITGRKALEADLRGNAERLRRSEAALRTLLESAPVILYAADADGTVTLSEGTRLTALGLAPGEAVGRNLRDFRSGGVGDEYTRRALAGEAVTYDMRRGDLWLHVALEPVRDADGSPAGFIGVCFDITERALAEERFRVLFEQSSDAHMLVADAGIIDCNPAAVALLGCADKARLMGLHPVALSPQFQPDGRRSDGKGREMEALARERGCHRFEWTHRRMDGTEFPTEITLTPVALAGGQAMLAVWHDLTERKRAEEAIRDHAVVLEFQKRELEKANAELAALATTDGLTGLKNHRAFQERLAEEHSRAGRYDVPLSLLLLDVDRFKQYNDAFGHPAGDEVLRQVAEVLRESVRETDLVARYGGEEFVVVLPQTDAVGARTIAERIRQGIEAVPWPLRPVTVSVGACTLTMDVGTPAALIARADEALYCSKAGGRNRVTHTGDPVASIMDEDRVPRAGRNLVL